MDSDLFKKIILATSVIVLSFLQHLSIFNIFGIKPNFIFVFLLVVSFFEIDFLFYVFLVLISYLVLRSNLNFDFPTSVLSGLLLAGFFLIKILPWQRIFNLILLVILLNIVFYSITSFQFVINNTSLLIGEILYNLFLGLIFYSWTNYILRNR